MALGELIFTFGRYQPPTRGHIAHFKATRLFASIRGCKYFLFGSCTVNSSTDPLPFEAKQTLVSQAGFSLDPLPGVTNIFQLVLTDFLLGYSTVYFMLGGDYKEGTPAKDMERLQRVARERGVNLVIKYTGERSVGISGSAMRQAVYDNDYKTFETGFPIGEGQITQSIALATFNSMYNVIRNSKATVVNRR